MTNTDIDDDIVRTEKKIEALCQDLEHYAFRLSQALQDNDIDIDYVVRVTEKLRKVASMIECTEYYMERLAEWQARLNGNH